MTISLFYERPVPLNANEHRGLRLAPPGGDYGFASGTNSVIVAGVEFIEAAKEYAIVFARTRDDAIVPAALLGLRTSQNLFVDDRGTWNARYIPAFVRRYPFLVGPAGGEGESTVYVDQAYRGFDAADGEALFDQQGEPAPALQKVLGFLHEYREHWAQTERFVQRLRELDLLMGLSARLNFADGRSLSHAGFLVVDEQKLLALGDARALRLFRSGELAWIYTHLASLTNLSRMLDLMAERD